MVKEEEWTQEQWNDEVIKTLEKVSSNIGLVTETLKSLTAVVKSLQERLRVLENK
jgi:polyhydroxyalkanoate synthesis regulator phasin